MPSKVRDWTIFAPENGGFRGVVRGKSENKLVPGQCPDMFNYIFDGGPRKRDGYTKDNQIEIDADTGITGMIEFNDGTNTHTFAKCGTRVFDLSASSYSTFWITHPIEAGDGSSQLSNWNLIGGSLNNTNDGVLYWKLTWSGTTATVSLYKNSDGAAGNLVSHGIGVAGTVTLTQQNTSGLSGSVTVAAKVGDDTDLENNTLIYPTLSASDEISFTSGLSGCYGSDGITLYRSTTGGASAVTILNESGVAISGIKPHGKLIFIGETDNRMWMTLDSNYPYSAWYSETDLHDRYNTDGGSDCVAEVNFGKGDGHPLTAAIEYYGRKFFFKGHRSWVLSGDRDLGGLIKDDGPAIGVWNQKGLLKGGDDNLYGWGPDGVWMYRDSLGVQFISDNIDYELKKISVADRSKVCLGWFDKYLVFSCPGGILDYCDGFLFDTRIGEWFPFKNWNISCMYRFKDDTLHAGLYNEGYIIKLFSGNVDGDIDISCYLKTQSLSPPGFPGNYEHCLDKLQIYNIKNGESFLTYWNADGDSPASGSWSITYESVGTYLGEFELGDEGDLTVGDIMISEDEITGISANPKKEGLNGSQRFQKLYIEVNESGSSGHSFDYLKVFSYPIGEVR